MRRRDFLRVMGVAAAAWPAALQARDRNEVARVGFIGSEHRLTQFRRGLAELGYVEGRDVVITSRPSDPAEGLPRAAAELVALKVDVIVAAGSLAVRAAQQATRTIPIVMTGSSAPVGTGFVESLAHPGHNITGLSLQSPELSGKRLQFLRETIGTLSRLAVLHNPDDPAVVFSLKGTEAAARDLGIATAIFEARTLEDFDRAFAAAVERKCEAVMVLPASLVTRYAGRVAELALAARLPAMSYFREFPDAGGLISYGPNFDELCRIAAVYVDRILKGAKPAELPVQQPTRFELVINMRTAQTLGIKVPSTILARTDATVD
jgi:putative ABC transport system substrate-binding protein